ncbi:lipopolysaccharide core biosynthesis protein RfaZ [Kluyvera sp. CHPC 1.251]|uniref:lipopolysaccharide core biosynthesis protein RfaZ n=1 Tax=Kluyvera sp. CHPC 1.251 TaxID=2995175 RepID=UPI002FD80077
MFCKYRLYKWLCKTVYRLSHSPAYKHNKNLWPFFKVNRNVSGRIDTIFYNKSKIDNISHLESSKKERPLLIMATGPSISSIDQRFFDDGFDYIGVNGAISMESIRYSWYAIIDRDFVIQQIDFVKDIVSRNGLILFCTYATLECIFSSVPEYDIRCKFHVFESAANSKIYKFLQATVVIKPDDERFHWHHGFGFSDNISQALFDSGTVAFTALQIGCALGYKKIYIAGLDMNNFSTPRFYETAQNRLDTRLDKDFDRIIQSFFAARAYCDEHNIEVINLSPESAVEAFPKMRWDSVKPAVEV